MFFVLDERESLCKDVSGHIVGWSVDDFDFSTCDRFVNKVIGNIYVLCPPPILWSFRQRHRTVVVNVQRSCRHIHSLRNRTQGYVLNIL
jgi:hypothetical protein